MPDFRTEYQRLYELIRDEIISGNYTPGEKLPQRKLASQFNSNIISVREAFRVLENDGLILIEPKWGAMVVEITQEKFHGNYIVREALEGMAARLAAEKIKDEEKNQLLKLAANCDKILIENNVCRNDKAKLHYSLHEKIVNITRCTELIQAIKRHNLYTIILSNAYHIDWHGDDPQRHRNLVQAIISSDPDKAESKMREHVRIGYSMELKAIKNHS